MSNEKHKWFSTGYLRHSPAGAIDRDRGIIEGVSVCTAGEAKGHGVHLDSEFIDAVTEKGSALKSGLKARFGHPNMCSEALGTFIGRFKNFRTIGERSVADLFLSNSAKDTPHGNLYEYVLKMANDEPDMFGTSIVFTPGKEYVRGEDGEKVYDFATQLEAEGQPIFVECDALHACDAVDEPAANDGLFSRFSGETAAGQITQFLDMNPQVFDALIQSPEVIAALAEHGPKVDEFLNRYRDYREAKTENKDMSEEILSEEQEETVALQPAEQETNLSENEQSESESAEVSENTEAAKTSEQEESTEGEESEEQEALEESNDIDREEFARAVEDFGATIAAEAFCNGGGYGEAQTAHYAALEAENAELKKAVKSKADGADPVDFTEASTKPKRSIGANLGI